MKGTDFLLEAHRIGRRHGDVWLLQDVDVRIRPGERLAFAGPSGAGKTLLLRALALLDPLDTGVVLWKATPVDAGAIPDLCRQADRIFTSGPPLFEGTVEDNLREPFLLQAHRGRHFDQDLVLKFLAKLGRDASFLAKNQRDLSGGEIQIVALVRALQLSPSLLLLDEPTAALDPETARAVEKLVRDWQSAHGERAFVWVSHDAEQIQRVADRIITLRNGRLA